MRLIDADKLKDYIDMQSGRPFIGCTVGDAMKIMIDEQPTIEERKKGHWLFKHQHTRTIHSEMRVTCNLCGYPKSRADGEILDFCPSCGADMRGEWDEAD